MNGLYASLLGLSPKQAAAVPLLAEFERAHPGVTVICPHHADEPWRAVIDSETVPGDDRAMSGHTGMGEGPAELLARLEALFAPEHSPP